MKKKIIIILSVLSILIIDRIFFMPNRIEGIWVYSNGSYLGDPIAYQQDYILIHNKIVFIRDKSKSNPVLNKNIYLLGCYLNMMYLYDSHSSSIVRYEKFR